MGDELVVSEQSLAFNWCWLNIIVAHGVFMVIPLQGIFLLFPFSLDCCLSALPKGECHLFCNDNLFSSPMSGCIEICPFMFISALWWNHGSNFAKPSLCIHVFLWLYSWDNLFVCITKVFITPFPHLVTQICQLSAKATIRVQDHALNFWRLWRSEKVILVSCLFCLKVLCGPPQRFLSYVFPATERVKRGLVYLQNRVGEIDTLGRLRKRLGSQRG